MGTALQALNMKFVGSPYKWGGKTGAVVVAAVLLAAGCFFTPVRGTTDTIAIATYNIEDDIDGYTTARPGLDTVIEAMGDQPYDGLSAQPIDILALEETTSNTVTVDPIVSDLNSYYGAGTYADADPGNFQDTTYGGDVADGNGPNALIYNTSSVSLVGVEQVAGTPTANGTGTSGDTIYRGVVRYEFQPVGGSSANDFYVYVSHMKSSSSGGSSDASDRAVEATAIRADAATLPSTASILYMGDFNLNGSSEAAYQTLTGTGTGTGQAIDPLNPTNNYTISFTGSSYTRSYLTESATNLEYRDDIQFMTSNVYNGTSTYGLKFDMGSYRAYGNNGTTNYEDTINTSSNTYLTAAGQVENDPNASDSTILNDLTTASDHLPVIADYTVTLAVPEPGTGFLLPLGLLALLPWLAASRAQRARF